MALEGGRAIAAFEYDPAFARSGIEIAPLMMPLRWRVYRFPQLPVKTFYGLPGPDLSNAPAENLLKQGG